MVFNTKRRGVKKPEAPPASDSKRKTPPKKNRYHLRSKSKITDDDVVWVDEDESDEESDDEDYEEESEEEETRVQGITVPSNIPVSVKIHLHTFVGTEEEDEDETDDEDEDEDETDDETEDETEDEDSEDEDEQEDPFLVHLLNKYGKNRREGKSASAFVISPEKSKRQKKHEQIVPALKLSSRDEREYFEDLSRSDKKNFNVKMESIAKLMSDHDMPFKFKILDLPITDTIKASVIKKIDILHKMGNDSGESHKLRTWVDGFLRVPFGVHIPLPVQLDDGELKCSKFLTESQKTLDAAVYGMAPAKTQIMQVLAQWIANPSSVGNVIALKGPMGVGKTSFARNGIATALKRPFEFFSLGGASDISHFVGHSYTYEGSAWGRITDSIMSARCMNPVFYFDELDKISGTPHGDEITAMLIHLTDRSQNMQYHDRYFAGIDFDLSQCLFVFSFNDETKVHPVLKDRMNVIQCSGYNADEKKIILTQYVWPEMLERFKIGKDDVVLTEEAIRYMIGEYSSTEAGVRSLIRIVESLIMRINLLRISDKDSVKSLKFFTDVKFPLKITIETAQVLLTELEKPQSNVPFGMYT